VKISVTFDLDDNDREAINRHYGEPGKASRARIKSWIERVVEAELQDSVHFMKAQDERIRSVDVERSLPDVPTVRRLK
jgi:hypothetical protein